MDNKSRELKSTLTGQRFDPVDNRELLLDEAKAHAAAFARMTEGIAVLSDFSRGVCHTYSGKFGQRVFSLPEYSADGNSPFEEAIFDGILKEDLLERHILELRFFNFVRNAPEERRTHYRMACLIRFRRPDGAELPVLHTSRYIRWDSSGSVWLGLCTYVPLPPVDPTDRCGIIDSVTGETVEKERYTRNDGRILSPRQTEILALLAKGAGSKQIADRLRISVHTVNRHRQDILAALKVANSASAVEIGIKLRLI